MRIVYVSWEYPPEYGGGIGTFVHCISRALAERGHRVTVITVTPKPHPVRERAGGLTIVRLPIVQGTGPEPIATLKTWQSRSDAVAEYLGKLVRAAGADVIEFGDYRGEGFTWLAATQRGERPASIVRLHTGLSVLHRYNSGQTRFPVLEQFENSAIAMADRLVSPSRALAREVQTLLPSVPEIGISPYPVDPDFLNYATAEGPENSDEALYVGRLEQRKGVQTLIRAAPAFLDACPRARIVLIGADTTYGPGEPSMKALLRRELPAEYHERVEMPGPVPREQLIERYCRARFCVFPSHFENFPNTCLEAMSLGRCVIGTDNSGMAEMIEDGVSGIIVKAADADDLARAMIRLYSAPTEQRARMGAAARERMRTLYLPERICENVEREYAAFAGANAAWESGKVGTWEDKTPGDGLTFPPSHLPTFPRPAGARDSKVDSPTFPPSHLPTFPPSHSSRIAVIIPCFNHGAFVREALESVAAQTLRAIETVVVDDGSTDADTLRVLDELRREGVRVIRQENAGLAAARNTGVRATRAPYFIPLDADDRIAPDFAEKLLNVMESDPSLGYAYGRVKYFGAQDGGWDAQPYDPRRLLVENLSVATALVRREAFELAGGYSPDMVHGFEDWDFWIALLGVGYVGRLVPEATFYYRKHAGGSMLTKTQQHRPEMVRKMIEHHRGLFAALMDVSIADKDRMFFDAHLDAWRMREALTRRAARGGLDDEILGRLRASAELEAIENSRAWRTIAALKGSWPLRAWSRLMRRSDWRTTWAGLDDAGRLRLIRSNFLYRAFMAMKRSAPYGWYARHRYGPDWRKQLEL